MAKTFTVSGLSTGATFTVSRPDADTWLTLTVDGDDVTVDPEAYTGTTEDRTSTVTVTASDNATATLPVTQYKKSTIVLTPTLLTFDAEGN